MTRPCRRPILASHSPTGQPAECAYPRMKGKQRCEWHWLAAQPKDIQASSAAGRLRAAAGPEGREPIARVPKGSWPPGERWCAGCQSFVPLFYCTGSRCKSCASEASHASRVEKVYGITKDEYEALFIFQGKRCYICQRQPKTLRLAVDHDHKTGAVRGLLCANNENGCNRGVIANLEAAADGGLAAARRAVAYFEHPPYSRMKGGPPRPAAVERPAAPQPTSDTPPPF